MSSPIRRNFPPQAGQAHGAGCNASSRGRWSGNGRRAGFCASAAPSIAAATGYQGAEGRWKPPMVSFSRGGMQGRL